MHMELYNRLVQVAKDGGTTHYSDIAPLAGLNMELARDRNIISGLLDEISVHEHQSGRPLLSAVVMHKHDNTPGQGFFKMAKRVGKFKGTDKDSFFVSELSSVHEYWSTRS